jgi:hypothetical protein
MLLGIAVGIVILLVMLFTWYVRNVGQDPDRDRREAGQHGWDCHERPATGSSAASPIHDCDHRRR